jgi:glycosyltransferase involved in cell wall biosynthesis
MKKNKFTILIPTRDRADVLRWSIQTCLNQDYDNYEIVVSDNFSQDNTRETVSSFNDTRIRYVNTGKRVSMSHNWEFGISQVTDGYVTILGDDDGMLPHALRDINEILNQHPLDAICWHQSGYFWPNNPFHKHEMFILMRRGVTIRDGLENFQKVIQFKEHYSSNPWLYSGFINIDLINKIKNISGGSFFHSMIPDVYSGLAIASQVEKYIYATGPFSIAAISSHSNGAAQFSSNKDLQKNFNTFLTEAPPLPYHPQLEFIASSFEIIVAECALQVYDHHLITDKKYLPDLPFVLATAAQRASYKDESMFQKEIDSITKIAEKNNIPIASKLQERKTASSFSVKKSNLRRYVRKRLQGVFIDGDKHQLKNVYDASLLHDKIYNSQSKAIFNIIKKVSDKMNGL